MQLTLNRNPSKNGCTISELLVNGKFECFVLEDEIREIKGQPVHKWKVYGKTAIPCGTYQVIITLSNRFKVSMPLLLGVEGFEGVRIHAGNRAENTEGCLLVGDKVNADSIVGGTSRPAYNRLFSKIDRAIRHKEQVYITITNKE
jgi:hypothetical protein